MLAQFTHALNLIAMSAALWMAFYLFARGFPNRITLLASLALFATGIFFLDTYNHYFVPFTSSANLRAALLVIALTCWYSVTHALLGADEQKRAKSIQVVLYTLAALSVLTLIFFGKGFLRGQEDMLRTMHFEWNETTVLYGITQLFTSAGILFNLFTRRRIHITEEGKYLFAASWFLVLALAYGILTLLLPLHMPRIIEDGFVFGGIFLLGISVARHQSLVEQRTIWQDFPVAFLGLSIITILYLTIAAATGTPASRLGNIAALVIATHSLYDIGREAVERWRRQEEKRLRRRTTQSLPLENNAIRLLLDRELILFLKTLNASSGMIATHEDGKWVVTAACKSLPLESVFPDTLTENEGVIHLEEPYEGLVWLAQVFEGMQPVALVGIGDSNVKLKYSSGELELLDEFSEQIGTLISINNLQKQVMQSAVTRVAESLSTNISSELLKSVEDALRHFADTLYLGQSPLASNFAAPELPHIERGKQLQKALRDAVESLRPEGDRPPEPLPREWYNYVILHDAYIKNVPNREVTARLYVSEGTFHRTRRQAVRGVARWLEEHRKTAGH
ncbi:MAG: hypothetical protein H6635_09970 [Anaerolineales bacterium]|nr:hypothetical protein [Anaerolineales bacterium]MCB9145686.1 hypothetical protein [Anaerolineales bacterium]